MKFNAVPLLYPVLKCNYYMTASNSNNFDTNLIRKDRAFTTYEQHSHGLSTEKLIKQVTSIKEHPSYIFINCACLKFYIDLSGNDKLLKQIVKLKKVSPKRKKRHRYRCYLYTFEINATSVHSKEGVVSK